MAGYLPERIAKMISYRCDRCKRELKNERFVCDGADPFTQREWIVSVTAAPGRHYCVDCAVGIILGKPLLHRVSEPDEEAGKP